MTYRIRDWNRLFENNRTRELKSMEWVPVPNKMDGSGYCELVDHERGDAHLGAWYAILEISSRQKVRGTIPQESAADCGTIPQDLAATCRCLSRVSRLPRKTFEEVIPRLVQIGWIEEVETVRNLRDRTIPQEGAESCLRARGREWNGMEGNGMEGNGMEGNGKAAAAESVGSNGAPTEKPLPLPVELKPQTEYPETLKVIRSHDASCDPYFVQRLADTVAREIISDPVASKWAVEKQSKAVSDRLIAKACQEVYATPRKKPPGTGLLLSTVPRILIAGKLNYV